MQRAIDCCFGRRVSDASRQWWMLPEPESEPVSPVNRPILYSHWKSSCPWRVRIALNFKNIVYDIVPVNLKKEDGEQHTDEFRFMNPMQQIPVIIIDNEAFIESMNILLYLEETRPYPALMPDDPVKRARVREICELIVCGTQPLLNLAVLKYIGKEQKDEWAKHWITRSFKAIEELLVVSSVKFCVGYTVTLADCCLVPQLHIARKRCIDLRPYPNMLRVDRNLQMIPAFIMAHADNQIDAPSQVY